MNESLFAIIRYQESLETFIQTAVVNSSDQATRRLIWLPRPAGAQRDEKAKTDRDIIYFFYP